MIFQQGLTLAKSSLVDITCIQLSWLMAHEDRSEFVKEPQKLYDEIMDQFKNVYLPPEEMWWEKEDGLKEEMLRYGNRQAPFLCPRALHVISMDEKF